jgi:hypothetical protein
MWTSIRLYVPATSLVDVSVLVQELSVKAHAVPCGDGSGATLYVISPHSPNDRVRFGKIPGVKFLPHPFSPAPVSEEIATAFPDLHPRDSSAYAFWSALFEKNPHPVLDPET